MFLRRRRPCLWPVVLVMSVVEFEPLIAGGGRSAEATRTTPEATKRTRIADSQRHSLKGAIVSVLRSHKGRTELDGRRCADRRRCASDNWRKARELANKLRQPLGELVADNKIHAVAKKRLMRYLSGPKSLGVGVASSAAASNSW